jgi:aspartate aminotransferase
VIAPLSDEVERWLAPQERFEAVRKQAVLRAGSRLADLAYANPYDGVPAEVRAALRAALDDPRRLDLQYTPYGGATIPRRLVADRLREEHRLPYEWRDVVLAPGAMAALNLVFRALVPPAGAGREVVVVTPCWLDVPLYLANLGLRPVLVPCEARTLRLDFPALARALGPGVRAVVIAQPCNPTGLLHRPGELEQLAALLRGLAEPPLLVADECHRDFVFGDRVVPAPAASYERTVTVYSFGKRFLIQGQRLGYAAVSPRMPRRQDWIERLERLCRVMGFATPTALMQLALPRLLGIAPAFGAIARRRERALSGLQAAGYDVVPSEASFFLYPRSPDRDDQAFVEQLAQRGVLVLPAAMFHHHGHFRISLTGDDAMLDRALAELAAARTP